MKCLLLITILLPALLAQAPNLKKFEYKHSFRAPNLAQQSHDGNTPARIPFWEITGDAIASSDQLRLAPSIKSRRGIAWNKKPFSSSEFFEVEIALKVTGQRVGADGLAIWYTTQQGTLGPVYGANDQWNGLGIFLDSYENKVNTGNAKSGHPYISAMINDGTRIYDHATDGAAQILAGCQRDYRNKPYPVKLKIEYYNNLLTVHVSDGNSQQPRYEPCIRVEHVFLPKNGFFGISATTGGLADDHDVMEFSTFSLHTNAPHVTHDIPQVEKDKYDDEFEKQRKQFEEERSKFKVEHPERAKTDEEDDMAKYYEDPNTKELRLIFESQNDIYKIMQTIEGKLKEIQNTQGVHSNMFQQVSAGGHAQPVAGNAPISAGSFQQHEKTEVMQNVRDLVNSIRDMKTYVNEIYTKTFNLDNALKNTNSGAANANLQQSLNTLQTEIAAIRQNQVNSAHAQTDPSSCPTCLGATFFLIIITVQSAGIFVFVFVRSRETKAKFY
uniref:L-type lectin-like domain-containing protein n=1 Tax=Rhabditophanes sp. KR3021 TaxID=114890 RepID=A0AC35TUI3_9BILA